MDLRKPGEEEDEYSEMAEEAMDPENCFPDGKTHTWPKCHHLHVDVSDVIGKKLFFKGTTVSSALLS